MRLRIAIVTALAALVAAVPASASGTLQVQKVDTSAFPTVRLTVQYFSWVSRTARANTSSAFPPFASAGSSTS